MMATYDELATLESDPDLQKKIEVALWIAAYTVQQEDPGTSNHANRLKWAKSVLTDSDGPKQRFLKYLLAADNTQTLVAIQGAADSAIQTRVDAAIDIFADGA